MWACLACLSYYLIIKASGIKHTHTHWKIRNIICIWNVQCVTKFSIKEKKKDKQLILQKTIRRGRYLKFLNPGLRTDSHVSSTTLWCQLIFVISPLEYYSPVIQYLTFFFQVSVTTLYFATLFSSDQWHSTVVTLFIVAWTWQGLCCLHACNLLEINDIKTHLQNWQHVRAFFTTDTS